AATEYLNKFRDSLETNAASIDYVESMNELIGAGETDRNKAAVAFDVAFAEVLAASGIPVGACLLNVAVGNPGLGDPVLVPAARAAVEHDGVLGAHGYWFATSEAHGLESHWHVHAGRALEDWDRMFAAHGLKPKYLLGECGAVASQDEGVKWEPELGWRSAACLNGDFDAYLQQLVLFNERLKYWNVENDDRCLGAVLFTTGFGWPHFQIRESQMQALRLAIY
ncbi:MAG: hypothetical protein V3V10_08005, partial [Planctomycetota bacterium]